MTEIRDVDVSDEPALHRWWEIHHDAQDDRPLDYAPPWEVARVALPTPHPDFRFQPFGAFEGEQMVGAALVNLPMADNLQMAYADVYVDRPARRHGVGSLLLAEVERRAREADRERVLVEVFTPPGGTSAGLAFAEARGYAVANREGTKAVDLAEAEPGWAALEQAAAAARGEFRVVTWHDACPEEYADGLAGLLSVFMEMVPQGELELESGEWTVERLRGNERRSAEIGQARISAAAVSPEGRLVGLSDLRVNRADPAIGYIGVTMVVPEARGHRLGLAMKLATHRALREAFPTCTAVVTSNADVNDHMNAVNEALGYRVLEQLLEMQKRL